MDIKSARRVHVMNSVGGGGHHVNSQVCVYWLEGRCNRNPCRFQHRLSPPAQTKNHNGRVPFDNHKPKSTWRNPSSYESKNGTGFNNRGAEFHSRGKGSTQGTQTKMLTNGGAGTADRTPQKGQMKLCPYWLTDNCVHGDKCKYLHSYSSGSGFSKLAMLTGHTKAITGIALPSGSDKLYSGSKDGSVRMWDCNSGQFIGAVKFDSEVSCLISEGQWVFLGLKNAVEVWNIQNQSKIILNGPVGLVCSIDVTTDMLFAGVEGGWIFAWKFCSDQSPQLTGSLKGHDGDIVSLAVGSKNRLYSGSKDNTVKVWDHQNMQCLHTLRGHSSAVTSVLCWEDYLLSGSLDNTIKVWAATESGTIEVIYEHREESGILSLGGIHDAEAKPILLCSCKDNSMRLYELPSLAERGRIFAKRDIQSIQIASGGLFFSGDETGQIFVWKLDEARS